MSGSNQGNNWSWPPTNQAAAAAAAASFAAMMSGSSVPSQVTTQRVVHGPPISNAIVPWHPQNQIPSTSASVQVPKAPKKGMLKDGYKDEIDECALCVINCPDLKIFLDCGHFTYCKECIKRQSARTPGMLICPQCKKQVIGVQTVKRVCKEDDK